MAIRTTEEAREHLVVAMRVALSTIPPYLYAMYSIEDPQAESARLIMSIVAEEMLHLALAANLLSAVGGEPAFLERDLQPGYPSLLAHHRPDLHMHLAPASIELVRSTFMVLERPGAAAAAPEADAYHTLGQFYAAVETAFEEFSAAGPLFVPGGDDRGFAGHHMYGPVEFDAEDSGGLVLVTDLASAKEAIEVIVHQGEGLGEHRWADPAHQELTHYAKLSRIGHGTVPIGSVLPVPIDPRAADYPGPVRRVSDLTNASYRALFHVLDALYRPGADRRQLVRALYGLMAGTLGPLARHLTTMSIGDDMVAAPTFELVELGVAPVATLARMAAEATEEDPSIGGIVGPLLDGSLLAPLA